MAERSVIHDTFSIERTYPVASARVFAAFASQEAKDAWGDTGDIGTPADAEPSEFDFRVGGRERFTVMAEGSTYLYDALYYDIVSDQRIVYSYEMYKDGARLSVSVTTIEFAKVSDGTTLTWTDQGAYLDGIDGADASALRKEGGPRCSTAWPRISRRSGRADCASCPQTNCGLSAKSSISPPQLWQLICTGMGSCGAHDGGKREEMQPYGGRSAGGAQLRRASPRL